jgi:hypothetical protein
MKSDFLPITTLVHAAPAAAIVFSHVIEDQRTRRVIAFANAARITIANKTHSLFGDNSQNCLGVIPINRPGCRVDILGWRSNTDNRSGGNQHAVSFLNENGRNLTLLLQAFRSNFNQSAVSFCLPQERSPLSSAPLLREPSGLLGRNQADPSQPLAERIKIRNQLDRAIFVGRERIGQIQRRLVGDHKKGARRNHRLWELGTHLQTLTHKFRLPSGLARCLRSRQGKTIPGTDCEPIFVGSLFISNL